MLCTKKKKKQNKTDFIECFCNRMVELMFRHFMNHFYYRKIMNYMLK